jgi:PPM family protein phosphatase
MRANGYSLSAVGSRKQNQDSVLVDNDQGLFAVADGIGGGERGDVASLMAVTGISAHPESGSTLRETVETIQAAVLKEALDSLGEARMGTTLTAVRIREGQAELCHVGDSRCYRFSEGQLILLTTDHETYDESYGGPVLSSYLGIPTDIFQMQIQEETFPLKAGERLLLCSDGLYKQIEENELVRFLRDGQAEPEAMLRNMVAVATAVDHSDNVSVVYIEIDA